MKHAVLITAYKDFQQLADLVSSLDKHFDIYIHIDKRAYVDKDTMKTLQAQQHVKSVEQLFPANWAGRNHVQAILALCHKALYGSPSATHFHLISGADLLVKTSDELFRFFEIHPKQNFMEFFRLPSAKWTGGGLGRLEFIHPLDRLNIRDKWGYAIYRRYLNRQMQKGRTRQLPSYSIYGGSSWWSLTREAIAYLCENFNWNGWYDRLKDTFAPDEMYVQTLLLNSPLKDTVVNNNLRYILWEQRYGCCPAILDERDIDAILNSKALFARKTDRTISARLIHQIDNYKAKHNGTAIPANDFTGQ